MKSFGCMLAFVLCVVGCATRNTIQSRQQERAVAYAALTPEHHALVDHGEIKWGMSQDAVYIAWGSPSEVLKGESGANSTTTWLYAWTAAQERRYWNFHHHDPADVSNAYRQLPTQDSEYVPVRYTHAEIVFENGVVKNWRQITPPPAR